MVYFVASNNIKTLNTMKINNIDFYEKERVLKDLSHKIAIVGASDIYPNEADSTCIVISI